MDLKSLNQVILMGVMGTDPQVDSPRHGVKVANFSIGTIRGWYDELGKLQSETIWHRVIAWKVAAVYAEKLHKGELIVVRGSLSYEKVGKNKREAVIMTECLIPFGKSEEIIDSGIN